MTKKTVRFNLHVAGEAPPAAEPDAEAWIGAAGDPAPDEAAPGPGADEAPQPAGSVADAMLVLVRGAQEAMRAGAILGPGPAADALGRLGQARTPAEIAAAQGDLARAGFAQGLDQMSRATRIWADAVAEAASRLGKPPR